MKQVIKSRIAYEAFDGKHFVHLIQSSCRKCRYFIQLFRLILD